MSTDPATLLWGVGALVLVGSGLVARRIRVRHALPMIAGWLAIFSVVFVLFLYRDEARGVWTRAAGELSGGVIVAGRTVRIARDEDGHYWARVAMNGTSERFLIDSGATTTSITPEFAHAAGIDAEAGFPVMVETANGGVVAHRGHATRLVVGSIVRTNAPVLIGGGSSDLNLLGMSFLSTLRAWRVEGTTLVLEP